MNRKMKSGGLNKKNHFLLVHGACHGAWSWYKVSALLKSSGHRITSLDLEASGIHPKQLHEVPTFAEYSRPLIEFMSQVSVEEKVILVGHSLGGISIAFAMEYFPEKILAAVFVAAFMPDSTNRPCFVLEKYMQTLDPAISLLDTSLGFRNESDSLPTSLQFGPQFIQRKLYQLCQAEDIELAMALIREGPFVLPDLLNTLLFSKDRYGSVDAIYIVCSNDLTIPVNFQQWMIANHSVKLVQEIDADHMPMLSRPQQLYKCFTEIAESYGE